MTDLRSKNDDLKDTNNALNRKLATIKTENQKSVERCLQMEIDIETSKVIVPINIVLSSMQEL